MFLKLNFFEFQVILELVETEQTYVENLARLMKTYFEPLSDSIFFSNTDIRYFDIRYYDIGYYEIWLYDIMILKLQ